MSAAQPARRRSTPEERAQIAALFTRQYRRLMLLLLPVLGGAGVVLTMLWGAPDGELVFSIALVVLFALVSVVLIVARRRYIDPLASDRIHDDVREVQGERAPGARRGSVWFGRQVITIGDQRLLIESSRVATVPVGRPLRAIYTPRARFLVAFEDAASSAAEAVEGVEEASSAGGASRRRPKAKGR